MQTFSQFLQQLTPWSRPKVDEKQLKKDLRGYISPVQFQRFRQDVLTWRDAITEAENAWYPQRVKMQRVFIDTILNAHVAACWERRKDLTLLRKWEFVNSKGKVCEYTTNVFQNYKNGKFQNKEWFSKYLEFSFDSIGFGYSLISMGDIVGSEFPNLNIVKRWNVSPDRYNVTALTYSLSGAKFMEEPYVNWHCYIPTTNEIGSSPCGFGLFYKIAIYEIFLRNLQGQNATFTELYSQPYRVGKTTKTDERERAELADAIRQMGSDGWALIDPTDEIAFLESSIAGTGYNGYDNFEKRLEAKISKLILGHADAMDSTAGKLGNDSKESPAQQAMEDKQTKDGTFIENAVNSILIPKLRNLGFSIPDDVVGVMKNDAEIVKNNNSVISQAVEMKKAGLQMDSSYFTEQTGIPVAEIEPPMPIRPTGLNRSVKNKLEELYSDKNSCSCGGKH